MKSKKIAAARLVFLTLLAAGSLLSQADRGTITGAVTDPNGAAVAGARVTVVNVDTRVKQTTTTTAAGEWTLPIHAGRYLPGYG